MYVFHYLLSINVFIKVTRNAISDFLTIKNTSGGECSEAQYHYCLHINPDISERPFDLKAISSQKGFTEQLFSLDITYKHTYQ